MRVAHDRYIGFAPCPCCDGAGEWDEGPLPASSGATEPDYRQVICPECEGTGMVECEARSLADIEDASAEDDGPDADFLRDRQQDDEMNGTA